VGRVARMERVRNSYKILVEKPEINHLKDLDVNGRIILELIFKERWEVVAWIHLAQDKDRRKASRTQ